MARLAHMLVYPLKSLDGVAVDQAALTSTGALQHDRRFVLVDDQDRFLSGRREPVVFQVRARWDRLPWQVTLSLPDVPAVSFDLRNSADRAALPRWCQEHLQVAVRLEENEAGGFPDDTEAPGPTVISTATLVEVASWFPGMSVEECRRRFRANLEIDGVPAFWEDRLFAADAGGVPFRIGAAQFRGVNPCKRCVVPSHHPDQGDSLPGFARHFMARRQATLPDWAARERFDTYYRLSVNTRADAASSGVVLRVGDAVQT